MERHGLLVVAMTLQTISMEAFTLNLPAGTNYIIQLGSLENLFGLRTTAHLGIHGLYQLVPIYIELLTEQIPLYWLVVPEPFIPLRTVRMILLQGLLVQQRV